VNNVGDEVEAEGARVVRGDGEDVGVGLGETEVIGDEIMASQNEQQLDRSSRHDQPTVDLDSLPRTGSITPPRAVASSVSTTRPIAPRLRRALTAWSPTKSISMSATPITRRRAPSSATAYVTPQVSPLLSNSSLPNTPAANRKRQRTPTVSGKPPALPTTRARSRSHSDILQLVQGYGRGAANNTVVISPGGVRVRGADEGLGLDLMEEE
jgi:hypothetical protein